LIRAIEIVKSTGLPIPTLSSLSPSNTTLILGIKKDQAELYKLIDKRVSDRFQNGLIKEVKILLKSGISEQRLSTIGLTYRIVAWGIKNNIPVPEIIGRVQTAEKKFSKRQMTWFKTDKRIHWIKNQTQAEKLIQKYLK
jgi:tRNA dimethylallyltransferase